MSGGHVTSTRDPPHQGGGSLEGTGERRGGDGLREGEGGGEEGGLEEDSCGHFC